MKRIVMLLFLSVMVCTLSAQEKKGETIGERIVANAYNATVSAAFWTRCRISPCSRTITSWEGQLSDINRLPRQFGREVSVEYRPTTDKKQIAVRYLSVYPVHSEGFLECLSGIVAHEGS